jgi:hypothetical protein
MPGMKKSIVKIMLIPRSLLKPRFLKTLIGGARMFKIIVNILITFLTNLKLKIKKHVNLKLKIC